MCGPGSIHSLAAERSSAMKAIAKFLPRKPKPTAVHPDDRDDREKKRCGRPSGLFLIARCAGHPSDPGLVTALRVGEADGDGIVVARMGLGAFGHGLFGVKLTPGQERQSDRSKQYPQHARSMPARGAETRRNFGAFKET
jgi:hypothetical protein